MRPARLSVRFETTTPPDDLHPAIGMFHRFIQRGLVAGLLLDVADYRHVPRGPGVVLIGHDVDYGLDPTGLATLRKRSSEDVATQLRDALRMGLGAIRAIAEDGAVDVAFDTSAFSVAVLDRRLGTPAELADAMHQELAPVLTDLLGPDTAIERVVGDDPREAPRLAVTTTADATEQALEKLGGTQAPGQSPWDISVEELARLREDDADFVLLDVREESEYETVNLGGHHVPLAELDDRIGELDRQARIVVHCRAGRRGAKAVTQLREAGFDDAWNVNGGLMTWIERIDPTLPTY